MHNNFGTFPCIDHTLANGSGHCMYVNGAGTDNVIVWQQELYDIAPNTDYIFITWVATLSQGQTHSNANELAHLQFSINGVTIGNIFNASSTTAEWNRFYQIWNSGNSTVATITSICCGTTCDTSAIVLISKGFESEFVDTACNQYAWNGVTYNNSGDYQQTLMAANGCDSIVTLHLTILKPTIAIRSDNSLFCETHEMTLRVESDYEQFEWNTGDLDESIVATEPGTYSVIGSNKFCSGTAQYTIPHCDFSVYIPNAITPGTPDGLNDFLSLSDHVKSEMQAFEIIIYDRWGGVVFARLH